MPDDDRDYFRERAEAELEAAIKAGHPDAAVDKQWNLNFTPATQLQINGTLPSGTLCPNAS